MPDPEFWRLAGLRKHPYFAQKPRVLKNLEDPRAHSMLILHQEKVSKFFGVTTGCFAA
jgi:hypothetical protein